MGLAKDDCLFLSTPAGCRERAAREKMWIVPLSEITAIMSSAGRVVEAEGGGGGGEKEIEWMSALSTPRRSSTRQAQERVSHTLTRVPWMEADARREPVWFIERHARRFS